MLICPQTPWECGNRFFVRFFFFLRKQENDQKLGHTPYVFKQEKEQDKNCNHSFAHCLKINKKHLALYFRHPSHISSWAHSVIPIYLLGYSVSQPFSQVLLFSSVTCAGRHIFTITVVLQSPLQISSVLG